MPEEKEIFTSEEEIKEEPVATNKKDTVKIEWLENDIWNGKTGYIIWEDPEDSSETSTVTVRITDFPTKDGFQEVDQNFEKRFVKPIEQAEADIEFEQKEEEIPEEPKEEAVEEKPVEEKLEEEIPAETEEIKEPEEVKEEETECCICHNKFKGYGNNPYPVCEDGRCCDDCNWKVVVPARIKQLGISLPSDIDFGDEEFEECEDCREHSEIPDDLD